MVPISYTNALSAFENLLSGTADGIGLFSISSGLLWVQLFSQGLLMAFNRKNHLQPSVWAVGLLSTFEWSLFSGPTGRPIH